MNQTLQLNLSVHIHLWIPSTDTQPEHTNLFRVTSPIYKVEMNINEENKQTQNK